MFDDQHYGREIFYLVETGLYLGLLFCSQKPRLLNGPGVSLAALGTTEIKLVTGHVELRYVGAWRKTEFVAQVRQ